MHFEFESPFFFPECHESDKFADPSDISGYFECKHGAAVKKSCPGNHVWNQEDKKCKLWHLGMVYTVWILNYSSCPFQV